MRLNPMRGLRLAFAVALLHAASAVPSSQYAPLTPESIETILAAAVEPPPNDTPQAAVRRFVPNASRWTCAPPASGRCELCRRCSEPDYENENDGGC